MKFWTWVMIWGGTLLYFIFLFSAVHAQTIAVGDSIALGTGRAMRIPTYARAGVSSCKIVGFVPKTHFDAVVVSAGINDAPGPCLERIDARLGQARRVYVLPAAINSARGHVAAFAASHGYLAVSYVSQRHGFHPRSYPELARAVWRSLGATR